MILYKFFKIVFFKAIFVYMVKLRQKLAVAFISVGKHHGGCPNPREICYKMIWF